MSIDDEQYASSDTSYPELDDTMKKPDNWMTQDERDALGEEVEYDGSRLTQEQRQALLESYFADHLELFGLRSPRHYKACSICPSVSESTWPGVVSMLMVDHLQKGYLDPEDLITRLRKLKPSENFTLPKFRHPNMEWGTPSPLQVKGVEILPPAPDWLVYHFVDITRREYRLGPQLTEKYREQVQAHRDTIESDVALMPGPDSHLLKNMGHSPGGTVFPWYLVKGLVSLRESANRKGNEAYNNEYDSAAVKRGEVLNRWRKAHPDTVLADDISSRYRTWPGELMQELDQIDRSAIRLGRQRYMALLKEAEQNMQVLVAFYRNCGLINGRGSPPSSYWQIPKIKLLRSTKPQYLQDKLDAINKKHGYVGDISWKLRTIETSRWLEATINGQSEPTGSDSPLPSPLLEKLETAWAERFHYDIDDSEDEMIAIFQQWRETMHARNTEQPDIFTFLPSSAMGMDRRIQMERSLEAPELITEPQDIVLGIISTPVTKDLDRQPRSGRERRDQTVWSGRLRPRPEQQGRSTTNPRPLRTRQTATESILPKPAGITKRRRLFKAKEPSA
ncbi:MAG: hypothetical protein Q9196_004445, partial [Gyalolechia fulgens]